MRKRARPLSAFSDMRMPYITGPDAIRAIHLPGPAYRQVLIIATSKLR
jgi:CheY-like chemotaxis protein